MNVGDRVRTAIGLRGVVVELVDQPEFSRVLVQLDDPPERTPVSYPPSMVQLEEAGHMSVQEEQPEEFGPDLKRALEQIRAPNHAEAMQPALSGLAELKELGWWLSLAETGDDSPAARGAAAALRFYFVRELGLPPLAAAEVTVIKGRLFVQSKLLRALAVRAGYRVVRTPESDGDSCTAVVMTEGGREIGRSTFTLEDARKAGLVRPRSAWETHPARMLWARAAKFAIDDYAPEVSLGLATDDERAEIVGEPFVDSYVEPEPVAVLDEDGEEIPF